MSQTVIHSTDCLQCGACCSGVLIVEAYWIDAVREVRLLNANVTAEGYGHRMLEDLDDDSSCILLAAVKPCKFLGKDGKCGIYPTRPNACVAMEPGGEECERARREAKGQMRLL